MFQFLFILTNVLLIFVFHTCLMLISGPNISSSAFYWVQVANFCSADDDGSFWSRMIKPEAITQAEVDS